MNTDIPCTTRTHKNKKAKEKKAIKKPVVALHSTYIFFLAVDFRFQSINESIVNRLIYVDTVQYAFTCAIHMKHLYTGELNMDSMAFVPKIILPLWQCYKKRRKFIYFILVSLLFHSVCNSTFSFYLNLFLLLFFPPPSSSSHHFTCLQYLISISA